MGFLDKLDYEIGICPLFFTGNPLGPATFTTHILFLEMAEDGRDVVGLQCLDIRPVTNHRMWKPFCVGSEIENFAQYFFGRLNKCLRKRPEIEPFEVVHAEIGDGMIEIKTIDVALNALQGTPQKNKKPAALANGLLKVNLKG